MRFKTYRGFTIIEVLATMLIIGILGAIAIPSYFKYIRKARVSEAISNLSTIGTYERTYYNEARHFLCLPANPSRVPVAGVKETFDVKAGNWKWLGNVVAEGTKVYFQYRAWAGRFDSSTSGACINTSPFCLGSWASQWTIGAGPLSDWIGCAGTISAQMMGIPVEANADFFFVTAIADQDGDKKCSLFVKTINRPDIYKRDQLE